MIQLAVPNLGPREATCAAQAITSGWVGPSGPFVEKFEEMVARAAGRQWAVATITGTAALHVSAFVLWNWRPCFRIWKSSFPAMANVRQNLWGHGPIKDGGFNHDVAMYEARGRVIADRAPAIGERHIINADVECYSFAANKIVTCGHGGAVVGDDPDLEKRIRAEIMQGYGLPGHFNYRMANINAAIGCAQMERLAELKAAKRRIWQRYADAGLPMVDRGASRWMSTVIWSAALVPQLAEEGIEARAEPAGVSIPCSTGLTESDQDMVMETCLALLR